MNKRIAIIVVVIAVAVVGLFVIPSLFGPPVNISGINPFLLTMRCDEVLPAEVADETLVSGSVNTETLTVEAGTRSFQIKHARAQYNGILIYVFKAQEILDAFEVLEMIFEDDDWYGGATSPKQTPNWFTARKGGRSAFFWRSGIWVFGVDAENDRTRNSAAEDLVQHLKSLSSYQ